MQEMEMSEKDESEFVTQKACQVATGRVLVSHMKLHRKLDSIEKRLFRDNGSVSIQTRLDRHEQVLRALLWVVGLIAGVTVTAAGGGVVVVVKHLLTRGGAV
jgi:hypothetical protein